MIPLDQIAVIGNIRLLEKCIFDKSMACVFKSKRGGYDKSDRPTVRTADRNPAYGTKAERVGGLGMCL